MAQTSSPPRAATSLAAHRRSGHPRRYGPRRPGVLSTASAATETPLSQTGWAASSTTSSASGDAPQNAISGDTGARFSSDAAYASGMYWQVINGTGAAVSPTNDGPSDVVSAS